MPLLTIDELEGMSPLFKGKIGNAIARELMKIFSVDKVSDLYDRHFDDKGPDFTRAVFEDIGYSYRIHYKGMNISREDLGDILPEGAFITVSNHPCGHIDGMTLVDMFAAIRDDYKVMVNKILARIRTLDDNFISVTPTMEEKTAPTSASLGGVKAALKHLFSGGALGLFPAGAVSDLKRLPVQSDVGVDSSRPKKEWRVEDRPWQESVIRLIERSKAPVIPVRFCGGNSDFYYRLGLIDWRLRLMRLLKEVFNKKGYVMDVVVGEPIDTITLASKPSERELGDFMRDAVYRLKP